MKLRRYVTIKRAAEVGGDNLGLYQETTDLTSNSLLRAKNKYRTLN